MRASEAVSFWRAGPIDGLFPWHWVEGLAGPMTFGWRDKWPKLAGIAVRLPVPASLLTCRARLLSPGSPACRELSANPPQEDILLSVLPFSRVLKGSNERAVLYPDW